MRRTAMAAFLSAMAIVCQLVGPSVVPTTAAAAGIHAAVAPSAVVSAPPEPTVPLVERWTQSVDETTTATVVSGNRI